LAERELAPPSSLAVFAFFYRADSKHRIFLELLGGGAGITSVNREQLLRATAVRNVGNESKQMMQSK
jgi:hypothetical protein